MIVICNGTEIELFDSMHNMTILRFQRFNKYYMNSVEIGSTFEDYEARSAKLYQFLHKEMFTEALQELNNRRQTVYNAQNEHTPKGKALAILVKRIGTEVFTDFSPSNLDRIVLKLDKIGFTYEMVIDNINEVKKKLELEMTVYFPSQFPKVPNMDRTILRHQRVAVVLDGIIKPSEKLKNDLFDLDKQILQHDAPNSWNVYDDENMERKLEVDFSKQAMLVQEKTSLDMNNATAFMFYSTVENLMERYKPK